MILHDRVTLTTTGEPWQDDLGHIHPGETVETLVPAQVSAVKSDESMTATADTVVTTYRMVIPAGVDVTAADSLTWRDTQYAVQGDCEQHVIGGRVHHQEALIRVYTG